MKRNERLLPIITPIWVSLVDIIITIIHQPKEYWNGNIKLANEGNPIGAILMTNHVSGIYVISALWLVLITILGYYLPKSLSRIFLLFVLIVHSWGASSWIFIHYGFWYVIIFTLINSVLFYKMQDIVERDKQGSKIKINPAKRDV